LNTKDLFQLRGQPLHDALAAMLMVGAGGIVLGVLALLGLQSTALVTIAVIAYGGALVLSSTSVRTLYLMRFQRAARTATASSALSGARRRLVPGFVMRTVTHLTEGVRLSHAVWTVPYS